MERQPTALVISNLPILSAAVTSILDGRYRTVACTWGGFAVAPVAEADLVVVDVTTADSRAALALLARINRCDQVVLCSLHENEVDVYRIGDGGLTHRGALPSLLDVVAA